MARIEDGEAARRGWIGRLLRNLLALVLATGTWALVWWVMRHLEVLALVLMLGQSSGPRTRQVMDFHRFAEASAPYGLALFACFTPIVSSGLASLGDRLAAWSVERH